MKQTPSPSERSDGRAGLECSLSLSLTRSVPRTVDLLLANNANPEVLSKAGWRPLEEAIATGARQVAETLMKVPLLLPCSFVRRW